ncbi:HesA/MoeB/ThiF family protein [Sphingomonas baiyangensis]|uniref:HesA/MoeB/ThiF family protein n=1 Tax=Sphingomonas baiyangensis TaxID=2572576 RepID=UPI00146BCEB8|nr:HesA/MoeB/ThiF family protein [Sphingomonas baiyangensis]
MTLSDAQLGRYARHIVLREVGGSGQARIVAGHVAVIGAGGIGSPAIQYLAAAGVGRLTLIDDDRVDQSNLQRQILFGTDDVGTPKVAGARTAVTRINPDVAVEAIDRRIDAHNAAELLADADVVIDGSDSFATRLAVADAALELRIPLVSASVAQFEGQLAVYRGWRAGSPCYRCFVGNPLDAPEATCAEAGVLGAAAGVVGSLAAVEALRALAPFGDDPDGRLLLIDLLAMRFRSVALPQDPGCTACAA